LEYGTFHRIAERGHGPAHTPTYNARVERIPAEKYLGIARAVVARRIPRLHPDRDDFIQDASIAIVRAAERYTGEPSTFPSFAFKHAEWAVLGALRKRRRRTATAVSDIDPAADAPELAADVGLVRRHLASLPINLRAVVARRFGLDGHPEMTIDQIADWLGVSRPAAQRVVDRGLSRLRFSLSPAV